MLTLSVFQGSAAAAVRYYTEIAPQEEYYSSGSPAPGRWGGKLAERLGLEGDVDPVQFSRVLHNIHPTLDEKLTPRFKGDRRPGFDMTFSVPKSVSLAWALLGDERIPDAIQRAVDRTMVEVEKEIETRVRVDGLDEDRVTGNAVWAKFFHTTARPVGGTPDPQLHIHVFVVNLTHDPVEDRLKAVQLTRIKGQKLPLYQAFFHHELVRELHRLGYDTEPSGKFWELKGYSRELIAEFSRRTAVIEEAARKQKITDPKEKGGLGAKTREKKGQSHSFEELSRDWKARAKRFAFGRTSIPKSRSEPRDRTKEAVIFASRKLLERASVISERKLVEEALRFAPGQVNLNNFRSYYGDIGLIRGELGDTAYIMSKETLAEERELVRSVKAGRGSRWTVMSFIFRQPNPSDSIAERIITSKDWVIVLEGPAGSGKTTVAKELRSLARGLGSTVVAIAPTVKASRGTLREEGFYKADTIAAFLKDKKLQESAAGGIIWLDEAGQAATKDVNAVLAIARKQRAQVVLVGDHMQHRSVTRGGCLFSLAAENAANVLQLGEIRRQEGELKDAITLLAEGKSVEGLEQLQKLGLVHIGEKVPEVQHAAAVVYADAVKAGKQALIVTGTNAERIALNNEVRSVLMDRNQLGVSRRVDALEELSLTTVEKEQASRYEKGQWIVFHRRCRGMPLGRTFLPGEVWQVKGRDFLGNVILKKGKMQWEGLPLKKANSFSVYEQKPVYVAKGDLIQITRTTRVTSSAQRRWNALPGNRRKLHGTLENGSIQRVVKINSDGSFVLERGYSLPANFRFMRHAYAMTSYMSQSTTVDLSVVCVAERPLGDDNDRMLYVGASRGRSVSVHLSADTDWAKQLTRSSPVVTAVELEKRVSEDAERQRAAYREQAREEEARRRAERRQRRADKVYDER